MMQGTVININDEHHLYVNGVLKSELLQMKQATSFHVQATIYM